ncbi:UNVERIFIED_CONTAM: hypothetical protein FKN15_052773 [Acipenser sinensis]
MQSSRLAKWDLVDEPEGPCLQTSEEGCSPTDSFTSQGSAVEYENLPHYEEIPEYMNLPFLHASGNRTPQSPAFGWQNSSSLEDSETSVYEVSKPTQEAYQNELNIESVERSFILSASKSPSSALSSVLHSIPSGRKQKKIPAALKEVSASTEDSSMSGYLYRSKGNKKQWKHLWFVIKNKVLYTYAASEDVAALESQPLLGFSVKDERSDHNPQFQLYHKNTLFYIFKADEPHTAQRWLEAFQEATVL